LRWLALAFVLLIAALQYPMWLGKGGWLQVRELGRAIGKQQELNAGLKARNGALDADVRDLKTGIEAVEERARSELGMVRQDEVFFELQPAPGSADTASSAARGTRAASASLRNESVATPVAPR
jgi:cell division protein FtsB